MGFFSKKSEGGIMDVIRSGDEDYLVWKWSPADVPSKKENAIRYGSSLRVRQGEVAVFVYTQNDGSMMDYIVGPHDKTIKTANFPILTSIVGSAFGGNSPFQAEIYFINLDGGLQIDFFLDYFDVADPRFLDFLVPIKVKGSMTFGIVEYKEFINYHRIKGFDIENLGEKVRPAVVRTVKAMITNTPADLNIPVMQIERSIDIISESILAKLKLALSESFKIDVKRFDIEYIKIDKDSDGYKELKSVTAGIQKESLFVQADVMNKNMIDQQQIGANNLSESLKIQREETQRLQRLQTESNYLGTHQINIQGDVAKTAAASLGELGGGGGMDGGGGGLNPAGMMTGMMMGTAVGGGMTQMVGNMMNQLNQPQPPPPPQEARPIYHISKDGKQFGPYTIKQMEQLAIQGEVTPDTYVWKQGMSGWGNVGTLQELACIFNTVPPPPPPMP